MSQIWPGGVFHLLGDNLNSALSREVRERKISDIHCILKTWDVQGGGFSKIGIDWRKLPQAKGLSSWFRTSQEEYWTLAAHNKNEDVPTTVRQHGGIAIFCREGIMTARCLKRQQFQKPWEMELMDTASRS